MLKYFLGTGQRRGDRLAQARDRALRRKCGIEALARLDPSGLRSLP